MTDHQFTEILSARIQSIIDTLGSKAKEYAIGDRLYNFKRAAEISRTTPARALAGMWMKHVVSVIDLIEGSIEATEERVNEKIGDAINYLILLEAVFAEGRGKPQSPKGGIVPNEGIAGPIPHNPGEVIVTWRGSSDPVTPKQRSELMEIAGKLRDIHNREASGDA